MTGVTPQGIRYPDGASKAKDLGNELQNFALDVDEFITEHAVPGPVGPRGPLGLPGVNAVPADQAVAGYAETEGSATNAVLDSRYGRKDTTDTLRALARGKSLDPPADMGFPLRVGGERLAGGQYRASITPRSIHARGAAGPTYYVDPVSGSNTNSGLTWDQAFKDPFFASMKTPDAAEIVVRGGFYTRALIPTYRRSLIIRAEEGTRPVFACCDTFTNWEVHTAPAWRVARTNAAGVIDRAHVDENGEPMRLKQMTSAGAVVATPGSWYTNGSTVYVRTIDSRTPDANVLVNMSVSSIVGTGLTGNWSLYVEGIEWWGGTTANILATGDNCLFLAKNCKFKFTNSTNGLSIRGVKTVVLEDCEASYNQMDGFNYHEDSGRNGNVVEINCVGRKNGNLPGSQNGSTAHESYKIVRIGGLYEGNVGANVADVNSAMSVNFGVTAGGSTEYGIDFYGVNMWLDGCFATGSPSSAYPEPGGVIRIHDCVFDGALVGNVVEY